MDIAERLEELHSMGCLLRSGPGKDLALEDLFGLEKSLMKEDIVRLLKAYCIFEDFGASLLQATRARNAERETLKSVTLSMRDVLAQSEEVVVQAATWTLRNTGVRNFRDQERFLLKLYGCYLAALDTDRETALDENLKGEKMVLSGDEQHCNTTTGSS
ncbi:hypothetical protein Tdes44962_MAKER03689 [Teratosphaeria destructans]|uniref:Uncharacterized protein n=1 Tax=Teratosphaeria destructans TaxID=418781 RepID=A0A9W7SPB4_9PEZI|nr:hypothetical protein Tdes44962_MAKER03689 [Teratosphaeria destructans]